MTGIPGSNAFPKNILDFQDEDFVGPTTESGQKCNCSVVIPTRTIKEVGNTINAVLKERDLLAEIIVIVDAPEISINNISDELKRSPVRVFSTGKRMGSANARNIGLSVAKGEVILFLDSDCVPEDGIIHHHLTHYKKTEIVGVGGIVEFVPNASLLSHLVKNSCLLDAFSQAKRYKKLWWNPTANFSVRKESIGDIRFDKDFPKSGGGEDVFFGFQLRQKGKIVAEPKAIVKHPIWPGWFNTLKRFFRWGWAESTLTWKAVKMPELKILLVRREITLVTFLMASLILLIPLVFILASKNIFFVMIGILLGWIFAAILSPRRRKRIQEELADQLFCAIFDLGSTIGRLIPSRWCALNSRVLFNDDQWFALWENTQTCERGGFLGGFIVFLIVLALR